MMRSSNPALRADTFRGLPVTSSGDVMTLEGTALRTGFLLLGELVEFGPTGRIFTNPADPRTEAYITGRFG